MISLLKQYLKRCMLEKKIKASEETGELLRPRELRIKYSGIRDKWSSQDIGKLLAMGLVRGKKLANGSRIAEKDLLILYRYSEKL